MTESFDAEDDLEMLEEGEGGYRVGYGKPPREHQFKPGNKAAAGRRKKRNEAIGEVVARSLNEKITVIINGKRRRITKLEAIIQMIIQQAAKSPRDAMRLLSWVSQAQPEPVPAWVDQKLKIEFVKRDWTDNPFPGAPSAKAKNQRE